MTLSLSTKFDHDFQKIAGALKEIAVGKSKQSPREKPESQLLNALEWYQMETLEAAHEKNFSLAARVKLLTRMCERNDITELDDDRWDMTFLMAIGPEEMAKMPTEEADRLRQNNEELERVWKELHNRCNANAHLIRQLQGNACTVKNKTRAEVGTMLQQAEQEASAALMKQSPNKNKNARSKELPSKMAEMALADSNKQMRQVKTMVVQLLEQTTAVRIKAKKIQEDGAGSEEPEEAKSTRESQAEDKNELEALKQEVEKLKTELEASKQELVLNLKERAVSEEEGWTLRKLQFSEVAAQSKEEAEKKQWATEFSRELTDTRARLKVANEEKAEVETRLQMACVSWNPTTSKEKEKLRAEIQELKESITRVQAQMESKTKEIKALNIKVDESNAETGTMTAMHTTMKVEKQALQVTLEEHVSEIGGLQTDKEKLQREASEKRQEVSEANEKLQEANKKLLELTNDRSTTDNLEGVQEARKQLQEALEEKITEQRDSKDTIDKQCREIGEARRARESSESEAAERIARLETMLRQKNKEVEEASDTILNSQHQTERITQLETALKQKDKEVEEAWHQTPPSSEWLVRDGELTHAIKRIQRDNSHATLCTFRMRSGVMERYQARNEQELKMKFRERIGALADGTQICSNEEAARLVRGEDVDGVDYEDVEWVKRQRNKMEKAAAVWECKEGDVITMSVETGDEDKPNMLVQGKVTRMPSTTLLQFKQSAKQETIRLGDDEYQVNSVISIKHVSTRGEAEANSPASTRNAGETSPSPPQRQKKPRVQQEFESPSPRNNTQGENDRSSDSDSSEIEPIQVSSPAVPLPEATPSSPNKSTWSGGSARVGEATQKEIKEHGQLVLKVQNLRGKIEKADVRTENGKKEFREVWRQVASPAYMYSPTIPLWSLATLLRTIAPFSHKMNSVVNKMVYESKKNPGMYEFKEHIDTEDSENEGSFKKRLCNEIYALITGTPWEECEKDEQRNLWKRIRSTGDQALLQEYMEQVQEDLEEEAAFTNKKRYEKAVSSTITRIGWESHPDVMQGTAAIRAIFATESTIKARANKFYKGIMKMYNSVLTTHATAVEWCISDPELLDTTYEETLKWLTAEYIGHELYNMIPIKFRRQWGLEEQGYSRGQNRSASKNRYSAHQVEYDSDYELTEALRKEGVSEGTWDELRETFQAELEAAEQGHDTLLDHGAGERMRMTVMSVENRLPTEKRQFFRTQDDRPERPQGQSYGSRGQPKPDPESAESMEYCSKLDWSKMSEDEIISMLCRPCEEHPPMNGKDTHHLNFQCCSCFHRMRDCNKMLIKAADKIRDWKGLTNADSNTRKKARFDMQNRAEDVMSEQTWIPAHVRKEIMDREQARKSARFNNK